MRKEDCYELGYILKPHGLAGEVQVMLDVDHPQNYLDLASAYVLEKHQLVPYLIEYLHPHNDKVLVKFEEIDTVEAAAQLKGKVLYLPLSHLPNLPDGQFYYHEVIGYQVVDEKAGPLGSIADIYDNTAQSIILMLYQGKEVLIPLTDELLVKVDKQAKQLHLNLPDGLLDIYLEESV